MSGILDKTHRLIAWPVRIGNAQAAADLAGQEVVDLAMSWDRRDAPLLRIEVHGMTAAFPEEAAALRFQMPNEVDAFHAAGATPRGGTVRE